MSRPASRPASRSRPQPAGTIRPVGRAEAKSDPFVAYAFALGDEIEGRLAEHEANPGDQSWVPPFSEPIDLDSMARTARIPHERSAALGALLHGLLCRRGGCDGSGGSSSLAYDSTYQGGHRFWVDATPTLVAELAAAGIGLRTAEFQRVVPRRPGAARRTTLSNQATADALAALIHRHCADPILAPGGCGNPAATPCAGALRVAWRLVGGLKDYQLSLVDLREARLVARHPGPGDPRDLGKRGGVRD